MTDRLALRVQREMLDTQIRTQRHHIRAWNEQRDDIVDHTANGVPDIADTRFLDQAIWRAEETVGSLIRRQLLIDEQLNGPSAA